MTRYLLLGGGLAFAAVIQPGPLQAFLLSRATSHGWKPTLPAALAPVLSDGPIILLVLLVLGSIPTTGQQYLRTAGGVLLLYLAWSALRKARTGHRSAGPGERASPKTLFEAASVNLLNPNPYLAWALVLGPALAAAWREGPMRALALLASFYGVMALGLAGFIILAGTARRLPPRALRALIAASAVLLGILGSHQLITGIAGLMAH